MTEKSKKLQPYNSNNLKDFRNAQQKFNSAKSRHHFKAQTNAKLVELLSGEG